MNIQDSTDLIEFDDSIDMIEDEERIEIKRYAFNSFRIEKSIRDILSWVKRGRIIIPEFQRDKVWNYSQASRFIESILLGLPVPDFFMFRFIDKKDGLEKYMLIDGLQRYTTINQYYKGTFDSFNKNIKFYIKNKNSRWNKQSFDSLNEDDKDFFMDYSLKMNVFESIDSDDATRFHYMTEIFERINTGSTKLSDQEIRNAIYMGNIVKDSKEFVSNQNFQLLIMNDEKKYNMRSKNVELLLRFLTYNHIYSRNGNNLYINTSKEKITSSKDKMICDYMYFSNSNEIDYKKDFNMLNEILENIKENLPNAFYAVARDDTKISNSIHETFSEALVISLMNGGKICTTEDVFNNNKLFIWRKKEESNYSCFFEATTDVKNVFKRVEVLKEMLSGKKLWES